MRRQLIKSGLARAIMDLYYPAFVEFADRFSQLVKAEGDG